MDSWIALDKYDMPTSTSISATVKYSTKDDDHNQPSSTTSFEGENVYKVPKSVELDVGNMDFRVPSSPQFPSQSHQDGWKDLPCDIDLDSLLFLKPKDMEEIMDSCEWVSFSPVIISTINWLGVIVYYYAPEVYDGDFG